MSGAWHVSVARDMLRPDFVRRKLHLIAEDLERLARFRHDSLDDLHADEIRMAAVERLLERIVMRAIDVNEHLISELASGTGTMTRLTYRQTFTWLADFGVYDSDFAATFAASAGLRNILVHDYNDVDRAIVHGAIHSCLRDYPQYIDAVTSFLDRQP